MKLSDRISVKNTIYILSVFYLTLFVSGYIILDKLTPNGEGMHMSKIQEYEQKLKLKPKDADLHVDLGWTYLQMAEDESSVELLEKSEVFYRKAVSLDKKNVAALYGLAMILDRKGELEESKEKLQAILEIDPKHFLGNYHLANLLQKMGEKENAQQYYLKAIELEPSAGNIYYEAGVLFEELGKMDKALEMYESTIKFLPDYKDAKQRIDKLSNDVNKKEG